MPAGASWRRYLTFTAAAMFTMFLGAQSVHLVYKPLEDLPSMIDTAKTNQNKNDKSDMGEKRT